MKKENIYSAMKKIMTTLLLTLVFIFFGHNGFGQVPNPPSGGHGQSGNQSDGNGAPIGGGLIILISLGVAYGGRKMYRLSRKREGDNYPII